ncbi:MAG: uncharacterized protein QOF78_3739 [Phycisphaerales bacterium]|nr:uncharacterized protein [Phycisphaerales bacterium]
MTDQLSEDATHTHTNRLALESSPYLLQHQHNPVDWYPWGESAFEAAREQNKPIFLSVGYSTCYWCHVMERQSFENPAVAKEMNDRFINIKVDREERPDVDQLYMTAVQVLTRHGGWPMSVFLTPDLRPFYGGTYFPPTDMHGRPGFVSILRGIEEAYKNRPQDVEQTANQIVGILRDLSEPEPPEGPEKIDDKWIDDLIARSVDDYEPRHGGFGAAPKFPRETLLELLLVHQRTHPDPARMQKIRHTLDAMAQGGIRDQLGGGFHRYSTDAEWLVPHFEIMLYDNAMLGWVYVEAYRQTKDERYARVAREIFDFILREMTSPDGPFYTAMDAEVDGQEGLNYLWTPDEIEQVLGAENAALFNRVYGVDRGFNFADPHHAPAGGAPDKNILFLADAAGYEANRERIDALRRILKTAREQRKQPLLDTKILTSWNALMIRALAFGSRVLNEPRYAQAAERAANFLLTQHRTPDGGLFRTSRSGAPKYPAFLDDYSFLIQALIELRDLDGPDDWDKPAIALADLMREKFEDPEKGGFYFTQAGADDLIVRQKTAADSPLPSGNAVAAMAMLDLDRPGDADVARRVIEVFAGQLRRGAEGMSSMVLAAHRYVKEGARGPIEIAPSSDARPRQASPQQIAAGVVGVQAAWVEPTRLDVHVQVMDGFHINANVASQDLTQDLIPTSIAVPAAEISEIAYPPGEERKFEFADAPVRVYEGAFTITIRFKQPPPTAEKLTLRLTYQACDDTSCLPPITKQFELVTR